MSHLGLVGLALALTAAAVFLVAALLIALGLIAETLDERYADRHQAHVDRDDERFVNQIGATLR